MSHPRIAVLDYGVGNINSVLRALSQFECTPFLTEDPAAVASADAIVLPGVGAFASGMQGLERRGLLDAVRTAGTQGKPMLGICLGAQLLLTEGHEFGTFAGLNLIPGTVDLLVPTDAGTKIPQIGWNTIAPPSDGAWQGTILQDCRAEDAVYFVHSYVMRPTNREHVLAETTYGGTTFCSAVHSGRIIGCQFHPEKSGEVGLRILRRFVADASTP